MFDKKSRFSRKTEADGSGGISLAPMVDVIFLLLIFFIVSTTFSLRPGLQINLPTAGGEVEVPEDRWIVSIHKTGQIFLNQNKVTMGELSSRIKEKPQPVILQADQSIPHGMVVSVLDRIRSADISDVNISTRPLEENE